MTSNSLLTSPRPSHRHSQHARLGSRSPTSIPSSPTSVHSSSSAIFERDIEPIVPPSPPFHAYQNPHRIPRAKGTEHLEHSVPSVLDSAAAVLTTLEDTDIVDHVAVVTPALVTAPLDSILARGTSSGFASPIGSFRSRSPSPLGLRVAAGPGPIPRTDLLLNIPTTNPQVLSSSSMFSSPLSSAAPPSSAQQRHSFHTNTTGGPMLPAIAPPTLASFASGQPSPTELNTPQLAPLAPVNPSTCGSPQSTSQLTQSTSLTSPTNLASPTSWNSTMSHPPSPTHGPAKRLSFMSYSDLLSSTPASTLPLSSLTTSASSAEPPPHIPSVSALNLTSATQGQGIQPLGLFFGPAGAPGSVKGMNSGSAATSLRGFVVGGITHAGKRDSIAMSDDLGGEWEREGMGMGLEERLEALIATSPSALSAGVSTRT